MVEGLSLFTYQGMSRRGNAEELLGGQKMYNRNAMIVFRIVYDKEKGWGAVSNFITKYKEELPMDGSDVQSVTDCVLDSKQIGTQLDLLKLIDKSNKFLKIRRPENIYIDKDKYEYIFLIDITYSLLYDVVELQNLFLIWDAHRDIKICALIRGNSSEYYKVSHYFTFLTENRDAFYESVYFKNEDDKIIRHLQIKNIGVLQKFLPLFPIDRNTEGALRQTAAVIISSEEIESIIRNGEKPLTGKRIIDGACAKLAKGRRFFDNCDITNCAIQLSKLNVLTFLLFCFSVENFENYSKFLNTLHDLSLWTDGCLQLIENIVFHSRNKKGAFSFRVLETDSEYIKEKYGKITNEGQRIELMISDYAGCNVAENIADVFRRNLKDTQQKSDFSDLMPTDFFVDRKNRSVSKAWEKYYSKYVNLINHYGLKIFRNTVEKSGGYFVMQSFSSHTPKAGEYYCSNRVADHWETVCMPGTGYSVLFGLDHKVKEIKCEDYGIRRFYEKIEYSDELFRYDVRYTNITMPSNLITADQKTREIEQIAEKLAENIDSKKQKHIMAINSSNFRGNDADVIYKAITLMMLKNRDEVHVVMYECQGDFVDMMLGAAYHFCSNWGNRGSFSEKNQQIVLYTAELYEEIMIFPGDWNNTRQVNIRNNFSRETRWKDYFEKWENIYSTDPTKNDYLDIPFDILVEGEVGATIFEQYVRAVVRRNIQGKELGCKIENTHMRLGSTIHVNHFYEAEVLFGNALFVERFALLLIKKIKAENDNADAQLNSQSHVTLYGYTNYSEQVIFRTMQLFQEMVPGIDVDYAILERETEDRGFTHVDQIRYSTFFKSLKERREYFKSRKIMCIIPIASTLKTNEKLINLFCEQNGSICRDNFIYNFELILVGSEEANQYWVKDGKKIIGNSGMKIVPVPEFFVEVTLKYLEPLECPLCFPDRMVDEVPLVEVNASSTIPNQAFGLIDNPVEHVLNAAEIREEEEKISSLKDVMLYRHLQRGENHFAMYFQTNQMILTHQEDIKDWLRKIKSKVIMSEDDFVILFCPAHFSNAGFVEYVNSIVFQGAAVVLRDDVDKEYRCNFKTKYSNLQGFAEKMFLLNQQENGRKRRLRCYFIDDAIISGRTFQRSKSLMQSVIDKCSCSEQQKYVVFDGIFVLLDRNSNASRWQYVGVTEEEHHFFAFKTVHSSSLRNHGDACVLCNLRKESQILKESAVTRGMSSYWRNEEIKFAPRLVGEYLQMEQQKYDQESDESHALRTKKEDRAFRRMICTNNATVFLSDHYHGNEKKQTLKQLISLVLVGCSIHAEEEKAEYFLSYCKVLSRPFRVFDRAVKEAVFDLLLVMAEGVISKKTYKEIIEGSRKKNYLMEPEILNLFIEVEEFVSNYFRTDELKRDFILVLLKQLTELKSNFIIRVDIMNGLAEYAENLEEREKAKFYDYYQRLVKKLLGVSSDTSKSLWFDRVLFHKREKENADVLSILQFQLDRFYLENVRVYQDAYKKLDERLKSEYTYWEKHFGDQAINISKDELLAFGTHIEENITTYQFKDFIAIMEQYGFYENQQLTEEGKLLVAANAFMHRYILSEFEGSLSAQQPHEEEQNLNKCNYIATYMNYIFGAQKTIIVMELGAEYDLWEDILISRYNKLAENRGELIEKKKKKEYIILGSSQPHKEREVVRDAKMIRYIQYLQGTKMWKEQGFFCEDRSFAWELGQETGHAVYVYAEWEIIKDKEYDRIERLNRIRNVMQYYWKLNHRVFNRSNNGFFHELVATRKKLLIHSRYKAHSHTKNDIRLKQFNHVIDEEKYDQLYQSDLLRLLADLNVSAYYRNSLTIDYYMNSSNVYPSEWNSKLSIFKSVQDFYVINSDGMKPAEVKISYDVIFEGDMTLEDGEEIIIFDHTNAEQDVFLLLYSLITNAATDNRGLVGDDGKVTVYLSRTAENQLRIANAVGENAGEKDDDQINAELATPPDGEKEGISLWSMSRYVKKIISCLIRVQLQEMEKKSENICEEQLIFLQKMINRLLSDEFATYVKKEDVCGKNFFSVIVPVLKEKYNEFL